MKKVLSLLTVAMLTLGLAACSADLAKTIADEVAAQLNVSGATVEMMDTNTESTYLSQINTDLATTTADKIGLTAQNDIDVFNKGKAAFTELYTAVRTAFTDATPVYGYGIFVSNQCDDCVIVADLTESGVNLDSIDFDAINEMMELIYQKPDFFYGNGAIYTSASGAMVSSGAQIKTIVDANVAQ